MKFNIYIICMLLTVTVLSGCEKFLDVKPRSALSHPSTLKDLRAILDNQASVNDVYPAITQISADEFVMTNRGLAALPIRYSYTYIWEDQGIDAASWSKPYQAISIANVVLEALERINEGHADVRGQLEGEALFLRGWMLFTLAQIYCDPYTSEDPHDRPGLVLRLDSDSEIRSGRSGIRETYKQIFSDLNRALELLPVETEYITRSSKVACLAALARAHLAVGEFEPAERMLDRLLLLRDGLLDYHDVDGSLRYPFPADANTELIYFGICGSTGHFMGSAETYIDPEVYGLYEEYDLRKELYYIEGAEGMRFRGFYNGRLSDYFAGLAMDEVYLNKAECLARRGEREESLGYLNELRRHRYDRAYFEELTIDDDGMLMHAILQERRRQLVCRGLRWFDLRRLNRDPRYAVTVERRMQDGGVDKVYRLAPEDLRYTSLIPREAIEVGNYEQNPR